MERKIGEIFEFNGEWYQCVESQDGSCKHCDMNFEGKCPIPIKECTESGRSDKSYVIFKKLEKVGEPYEYFIQGMGIIMVQEYILANANYIWEYNQDVVVMDCQNEKVAIEIKQTKEDMEEEKHSNLENTGKNLKPFDLQKAKAGKPVCTRDGRKARIICFDVKAKKPIAALITNDDTEEVHFYYDNGRIDQYQEYRYDLMMLPEKKEGWVNVYKDSVYDTHDEALIGRSESRGYIDTIKINWEE